MPYRPPALALIAFLASCQKAQPPASPTRPDVGDAAGTWRALDVDQAVQDPNAKDPIILGSLDKSLIDGVIKKNMETVQACYQRALSADRELSGKVIVKFVIARDGTVPAAEIKSSEMTKPHPRFESCLTDAFRSFVFAEPKGGGIVIVSYPFVFTPQ